MIFIERTYTVDDTAMPCRFFKPEPDRGDFLCRYEVDWPDTPWTGVGNGVDTVQALLLAMQAAHIQMIVRRDETGARLLLDGEENLAMPLAETVRDLAPISRV
ncbi:DUF6968 family protein [Tropicibacter alexandrii]|uniref:DUF6968 family protein n=1 Tax=Tropicibacter alexandrii TaxID=2267683 RepID=UPI000EF52A5C|nr:hypothetical protein [Tropicibacter alexandrii]